MSLSFVGALMALAAPWDRIEQLALRIDKLMKSQARLIDRIEDLERELDLERSITAHWKGEAARFAIALRERREIALRQPQRQSAFDGWCNCVPSRAQVWGAQHGLVKRLNQREV